MSRTRPSKTLPRHRHGTISERIRRRRRGNPTRSGFAEKQRPTTSKMGDTSQGAQSQPNALCFASHCRSEGIRRQGKQEGGQGEDEQKRDGLNEADDREGGPKEGNTVTREREIDLVAASYSSGGDEAH